MNELKKNNNRQCWAMWYSPLLQALRMKYQTDFCIENQVRST